MTRIDLLRLYLLNMKKKFYIFRRFTIWWLISLFLITPFSIGQNNNFCKERYCDDNTKNYCEKKYDKADLHSWCSNSLDISKTVDPFSFVTMGNKICDISCFHKIDNFSSIPYVLPKSFDINLNYFNIAFIYSNNLEINFIVEHPKEISTKQKKKPIYITISSLLI